VQFCSQLEWHKVFAFSSSFERDNGRSARAHASLFQADLANAREQALGPSWRIAGIAMLDGRSDAINSSSVS